MAGQNSGINHRNGKYLILAILRRIDLETLMALQSMTGFSRSQGDHETGAWVWELRSVNHKGLDVRLRMPHGFEALEIPAKKKIGSAFGRGSIQASLQFVRHGGGAVPRINQDALDAVLEAAEHLQTRLDSPKPTIEGILSIKGVLEIQESELPLEVLEARSLAVMDGLSLAIDGLVQARDGEGQAIVRVLLDQVDQIERLVSAVISDPSRKPEAIAARLQDQLARISLEGNAIDPQRLHQEAAVLATKADLQEELDRLIAHVNAARDLLHSEGPAGRKLDFLAQEFNRECNTLCSKSNAATVTALGLELKIIVDQLREQTQNLE